MNRTRAAVSINDTEVHPWEERANALDAFGGILVGVLAGSAMWLAIIAVVVNLL